ncbi:lysophospholipid acyltransferase family protein [Pelobium manganitolerans]|uniref:lysophospholipid acyltransferase family protein n=1 Tax=Pelobium manganitolerans TaxID=1842495 RepID=UPI003FA355CB
MINKGLSKAIAFFLYLVSLLPMPILYLISDVLYYLLYCILGYRKKVVRENLQKSFPEKSVSELLIIERKYFRYLADLMMEVVKMFSASERFINSRFKFSNTDLLNRYEASGQSYLFVVGHYGNWEWSALVTPLLVKAQTLIVYKPLNNPIMDGFFKEARERTGAKMVKMRAILREMVKRKNELTVSVFAADQTPARAEIKAYITFLNQETPVFLGIEKMARSTNYPVVFCDIERRGRGYYNCDFKLVCDKPKETADLEITKAHTKLLENRIIQEPAYWLWSHKRWKYKPEE